MGNFKTKLTKDGREINDPTPMMINTGIKIEIAKDEIQLARELLTLHKRLQALEKPETLQESLDFDVKDSFENDNGFRGRKLVRE